MIPILRDREVRFITEQVGTEFFLVPATRTGFRFGDLARSRADEHGNIRVTGRLKDIVIRNAENISALEVEDAVFQHPDVREVAVIGVDGWFRTGARV